MAATLSFLAEVAVPRELFQEVLRLIEGLRPRPAFAQELGRQDASLRWEECV